jgi:hypothetical protein
VTSPGADLTLWEASYSYSAGLLQKRNEVKKAPNRGTETAIDLRCDGELSQTIKKPSIS